VPLAGGHPRTAGRAWQAAPLPRCARCLLTLLACAVCVWMCVVDGWGWWGGERAGWQLQSSCSEGEARHQSVGLRHLPGTPLAAAPPACRGWTPPWRWWPWRASG
jgi:hypothetical protein